MITLLVMPYNSIPEMDYMFRYSHSIISKYNRATVKEIVMGNTSFYLFKPSAGLLSECRKFVRRMKYNIV